MLEIDPVVFGPGTWMVTHVLGLVSDQTGRKTDRQFYKLYIYRMVHALPCGRCRRHAVRYLDRHPVEEGSMFVWSVAFHNAVNKRLNKKILSVEEARVLYENTEIVLKNNETGASCSIKADVGGCEDAPL